MCERTHERRGKDAVQEREAATLDVAEASGDRSCVGTREAHQEEAKEEAMKPSEYGGSDTDKTLGIQPAPHQLTAEEKLRVQYKIDAMDEEVVPVPGLSPVEG